jgi:hypothetical protein
MHRRPAARRPLSGRRASLPDTPTVAALYVETDGAYFGLPGVDPWDEKRDARQYAGPHAVVAHPPCNVWSVMSHCRPEIARGADGGCFQAALAAVRRFGGVLEHPANSHAWSAFGLMRPPGWGWGRTLYDEGWVCRVDQALYGAPFRKPTWLYVYGVDDPPAMLWGRAPSGGVSVGRLFGSGRQHLRARTPDAFREVLLGIARNAQPSLAILPATVAAG